jgi:hypothetical protein
VLYALLVCRILVEGVRLYFDRRDALSAAVLGVLIVCLGSWLNGGYYALSPLVWLLIGWIARERSLSVEEA